MDLQQCNRCVIRLAAEEALQGLPKHRLIEVPLA